MENVTYKMQDNTLVFAFNGKISSENAAAVEEKVNEIIKAQAHEKVVVDAENLEYISSAGLRVILRLKKAEPSLKVINVSADVYEIFDMTGFTEIITIEKAQWYGLSSGSGYDHQGLPQCRCTGRYSS